MAMTKVVEIMKSMPSATRTQGMCKTRGSPSPIRAAVIDVKDHPINMPATRLKIIEQATANAASPANIAASCPRVMPTARMVAIS